MQLWLRRKVKSATACRSLGRAGRDEDGVVLRADVYRPVGEGRHPVILSYGPYAKGLSFQEGYKSQWSRVHQIRAGGAARLSNKYQNWELVDPEKWVPDVTPACVDSRGAGRFAGLSRCLVSA